MVGVIEIGNLYLNNGQWGSYVALKTSATEREMACASKNAPIHNAKWRRGRIDRIFSSKSEICLVEPIRNEIHLLAFDKTNMADQSSHIVW